MLAARRNDNVIGRTATLIVSIKIKKGFNQSGAPSGKKCAVNCLGLNNALDIINDVHNGTPIDKVNTKCDEIDKENASIPIILQIIKTTNNIDNIIEYPFILVDLVRIDW